MSEDLKRGFRSLVSSKVLVSIIGVVSLPFVVRILGPDGYGDYAFLMSTFSMLMILVSPAITEGVQKFVAEERADRYWREHVVGFYLQLAIMLAIPGGLILAAATWTGILNSVFDQQLTLLFYLLAIHVVTAQLQVFSRHTLLGLGLEHISEPLSVLKKALSVAVGLSLAVLGFGVAGFLVGHIVAAVALTGIGFVMLGRELSVTESLFSRPHKVPVRELLSFNALNIVLVILMQSLFHVDIMMLQFFEGGQQTGYYKAALVLAEYIWLVPAALQRLMLHSASRLWSQDRRERIQSLASRFTRHVFLVTALLAIGIVTLADRFVPLYFGADFRATILPLTYLLPGAVGFALARPLYGINQAKGQLKPLVLALGVSAIMNLVLNALLIPRFGTTGAAIATSTSYGSMFALQVACARYFGYAPLSGVRPTRLLATVVLSAPLIYGFDSVLGSDLLALALVPVVGAIVFTAISLLSGAIDVAELRGATTVLPSPLRDRFVALVFDRS